MKKIFATLLMVVMVMGLTVNAFAYNGDPTTYMGYNQNSYGNGYGYGRYNGWRYDYNNRDFDTDIWFENYEDEVGEDIMFGVYPDDKIVRDEVGAVIGKATNMAYEEVGRTFSTRYGVPYPDFTWSQDLWEIAGGLYQKKIMNGYPDNTFRGYNNVKRGEFAKILVTTLESTGLYKNINVGFEFWDMKETNHWASRYASECQALGLFNGFEDGSFRPDEYVTYQQFVAVMIRLTELAQNSRYAINFEHMAYGLTTSINIDIEGYENYNNKFELSTCGSKTVYLSVGETVELKVKATPSDIELNKNDINWEASKSNYVKLSSKAIEDDRYATVQCKALKEGKLTVTAVADYDEDITAVYNLVITEEDEDYEEEEDEDVYVTSITVNPTSVELEVGQSKAITATVKPSNATDKGVTWKSHNTSIATVDQNGNITAKGVGNTTVTATANDGSGIVATIDVIVKAEEVEVIVDSVKPVVQITGANVIKRDEKVTLTVTAFDDNLTYFEVKASDILGMVGTGVSIHDIIRVSDTKYEVVLLGTETAAGEVCIAAGVAKDAAGNISEETKGIYIKVNANE